MTDPSKGSAQTGTPLADAPPAVEARRLAAAARSYLQWLSDQGVGWVPGGATPRRRAALGSPAFEVDEPYLQDQPSAPTAERVPLTDGTASSAPSLAQTRPAEIRGLDSPPAGARGLAKIREVLGDCKRCKLANGRIQLVFGEGNPEADLMFVGEAPGRDEDLAGEPFVGAAGALLAKMITAMGLTRGEVYIANVIKCRPPRNRDPEPDEVACCLPFVRAQIEAVRPRVIVTLGRHAAQALLSTDAPVGKLRGRFHSMSSGGREIPVMPTYHPAYLLRSPEAKRPVWEDLKQVIAFLRTPDDASR